MCKQRVEFLSCIIHWFAWGYKHCTTAHKTRGQESWRKTILVPYSFGQYSQMEPAHKEKGRKIKNPSPFRDSFEYSFGICNTLLPGKKKLLLFFFKEY